MMGKLIAVFVFIIVVLGGSIFGVTRFLQAKDSLEKADAIVAVSGGDTTARALKAISLYSEGYAPLLVFSGAAKDPDSPSNALVMQELAIQKGVPPEDIRIDENSRDTKENASGVKTYLAESKKIILVTSEYHQKRANKELQAVLPNVEIINAPADDKNWNPQTWWLTPYGWWITMSEVAKNIL